MRTAYRCRAYPTADQAVLLNRTFGCIRVVWNRTLAERHATWAADNRTIGYAESSRNLTIMKRDPDLAWLNEVSAVALQQCLRHQQTAFANYFAKRARYPRYKSRASKQSASFSRAGFVLHEAGLYVARIRTPIHLVWSWPEVDLATLNPSSVVITRQSDGRWFVSFKVEQPKPDHLPPAGQTVGVDLGLKGFAVLSTGEKIVHPRHMDKHEQRLKRYQRQMSRRKVGSANRAKMRRKVARQHSRVADARKDFLHKTSTDIVRRFDRITIEDLAVSNMVKNRCLSKSIGRTGWGEFRRQLTYKAERYGRTLVVIDRFYPSSKTCSHCGHLLAELSLSTRTWTCPTCGTRHDRDINAAKNIDNAAGLVVSACGCNVRRSGSPGAVAVEAGTVTGASP